jgi:hypothetical protein
MTTTQSLPVYVPSGKTSPRLPAALLLAGIPGIALCAGLYALWLHHSPNTLISLFGLMLFSVFSGLAAWYAVHRGHCRSFRVCAWAGVLLAALGCWLHWGIFLYLDYDRGAELAWHWFTSGPAGWMTLLGLLAQRVRELEPARFGASWLAFWWALEALLLIWIPAWMARMVPEEPYSEAQGCWADKDVTEELWWDGGLSSELASRLAEDGVDFLLVLPRAVEVGLTVASEWWTISLKCFQVEADPTARWLSVGIVVQKREDNGKVSSQRTPVVSYWQLSAADYTRLVERLRTPAVPWQREEPAPAAAPLDAAVAAFESGSPALALSLAENLRTSDDPATRADALRLCALSLSRLECWDKAYDDFHALFAVEPGARNALQLATTSVMAGQTARGAEWFAKAEQLNADSQQIAWPTLLTGYLSALANRGEWAAGLPQLERLRGFYESLPSSDDHFLYTHDLPFLGAFLEKSLPFLQATRSPAEIRAWYGAMAENLDEDGQQKIAEWLAELPPEPVRH